jgi:4-amino-4-deoxy-L-arabinose transferase-like glycosyltransferase
VNFRRAVLAGVLLATTLIGTFDHDLWAPDEPRAAELGRSFLESGSWSIPRLNGEPFLEKPPLVYWTIAASLKVFGLHDWAVRLPALLFAWGTLLFTGLLGRRLYGPDAGNLSMLVLATSAGFLIAMHHVESDAGLLFFVTATAYFLWRAIEGSAGWYGAATLAALGAFFSKGFIGLVLPGLLLGAWTGWTRTPREFLRAKPWIWLPILAAPIVIWLVAIGSAPEGKLLRTFLFENHVQRFLGVHGDADRGHQKPIWYYVVQFPMWFLPWIVALAAGARGIWSRRGERPERFLLAWAATGFLFLCAAGTKRAVYLLPLMPPLSILVGRWLAGLPRRGWVEPAVGTLTLALAILWFSFVGRVNDRLSCKPFCRSLASMIQPSTVLYAFDVDETVNAVVPFYMGRHLIPVQDPGALVLDPGAELVVITVDVRGKDWHSRVVRNHLPHLRLAMPEGRDHRMLAFSNVPSR